MIVLSLFDGISCGQIALQKSNIHYDRYYASEVDKYAIAITQKNYPNTIQLGDVQTIQGNTLPKIDLLIGGSPCQGFSLAGKQLNFQDTRSKLFFEFVRLLEECQPTYFLLENVPMKKEYEDIISDYLHIHPLIIDSALVSAQRRKRLYWTNIPQPKRQLRDKHITVEMIKESHPNVKYNLTDKARAKIERYIRSYKPTGKSPTLTTELAHSTGSNITPKLIMEIGEDRRATPLECERLQTVPDGYTAGVSDTQRYKALGNGWTVDVIRYLFRGLQKFKERNSV